MFSLEFVLLQYRLLCPFLQVEIEVNESLVGAVIGPAGKSIVEMQHYTGTQNLGCPRRYFMAGDWLIDYIDPKFIKTVLASSVEVVLSVDSIPCTVFEIEK